MGRIISAPILSQEAPEDFKRKLFELDPDLQVSWNKMKQRWIICICTHHSATAPCHQHDNCCAMSYVWMVQDEDGDMIPLGNYDWIMNKLKSIDTRRQYGDGPKAKAAYLDVLAKRDQDADAAEAKAIRDRIADTKADHRKQLNEAVMLMERHDWMRPNR